MYLLFWTSVSTVGLSERGLNSELLDDFTCCLTAICYVLYRKLVLGFWGSEPETNLKWRNIYWSCVPPILDFRLDCRPVWEGSELLHVALRQYSVFVQRSNFKVSRFGVTHIIQFTRFTQLTQFTKFTQFTQFMFYFFFGKVLLLPHYMPLLP